MLSKKLSLLSIVLVCAGTLQSNAQRANYTTKWEVKTPFTHNVFIENKGQFPASLEDAVKEPILYYSVKGSMYLFFSQNCVTFLNSKLQKKEDGNERGGDRDKELISVPELMSITWDGANTNPEVTVDKESADYYTYSIPHDKSGLGTITAHGWSKLTYHNLYNGIDVVFYYPNKGGLEYDIIVHPGADPSVVKMNYTGAKAILKAGNIYLSSFSDFTDHAPTTKDEDGSSIASSYTLNNNSVSFRVGNYDRSKTITIDPWVTTTSFTTTNSAYDIGYDIFGNVYVYGGGATTDYQLQKYNGSGVLQWTYTTTFPVFGGLGGHAYGDLVTDTRTGVSYLMGSEDPSGCQIVSVSPGGAVIHTYPGTSQVSELWRIDLDYCHNLLIIGSGENGGPYQAETIDTALTTFSTMNVLNYDSSFHDMCLLGLDQQGHAYMAQSEASGASTQNMFNNVFMQLPVPSLLPAAYFVSDGYTFQEIGSIKYYPGGFGPVVGNGMNGLAASKSMVVTYDGATVKKWTTTGTLKKSQATGGSSFTQGGVDLDCQGHIYVGNGSTIAVYDSTLTSLGTIPVANTVYDLKIAGSDMAYACGKTFVGAYKNTYVSKMVTITATAPTACSACNGQATANVSCGSGNYTYQWSNGATTSTITGLCQGIYSVTVIDASTCAGAGREDTASVKFIIAGGPTLSISSKTNALCNGGGGGSATVNATGGGPFTYSWAPSGGTNATATNLSEGSYTVTVKNSSGCISIDTVSISQPSQIQIGVTLSPSCSGSNGSATAIPSGGIGPYTYSWAPSGGTNATASGLAAGSYTVTVTDKNGCTQTQAVKVTTATGVGPTVTVNPITPASCSVCNGAASVTASGGTAPYTFNWSNGATTSAVSNLCGATYTVSVGSAGDTVIVPFYTEDFGTGGTGWSLSIKGTGTQGTNPNKWVVDNNGSLCNAGGNYLHVACSATNAYYTCNPGPHYDPGVPNFDNSATDLYASSPNINTSGQSGMVISFTYQCDGNVSGSSSSDYSLLSFSSNGGTTWTDQPTKYANTTTCTKVSVPIPAMYNGLTNFRYAFRWINKGKGSGNDPGMAVDSISIGSKSFVTGCPTAQTIVVPPNGSFSVSVTPTSASCGANNGSATVTPTPTGTYTYKWSNGQTTQTANNLASGSYTVIVSVSGGCADTTTVTINNSGGPSVSSITRTDVLCNGSSTGDATANVTGGATPYTYNWSSGQTTSSANNLAAGTYTCTVKDKNGCQTTDTVIITQPTPITAKVTGTTQANCGTNNGSATISASGGTGAYKYNWSPSGGTGTTASGLGAGSYTCTVTDANNCTQTVTASISNTGGATVTSTTKDPLCNGNLGSAIAVVTSGTAPFSYTWPASVTTHFDSSATNLAAGTYICAVADKNGCITNDTIVITQPAALAGTPVVTNAGCGVSNGNAVMYATGGTGAYSYSWNTTPIQTTSTASALAAGSYTCTITDANGCSKQVSVIVGNANAPTVSATQNNEKCFGDNIGNATVTATGGSGAYTYLWSGGQTTSSISNLGAGTYTCTVTDGAGCKSIDTVKISQPTALASTITPTAAACGKPGSAKVTPMGGTGPYTYSWNTTPVQTTNPATNLAAGSYTCTVTDANNCTQQLTTTITGSSGPVVTISSDTLIKQGSSVTISATGGGTYAWSPSTGLGCSTCASTTADPTKSTTYCVLVTDITSGCSDSACMTINVEVPCGNVWVPNAFSPNGDNENDRECVYGGCLETLDFSIFDRWGNRVFHTTDPSQTCWDGIYNGKVMNTGVFVYYLDAVKTNGDKVTLKGNITLVR